VRKENGLKEDAVPEATGGEGGFWFTGQIGEQECADVSDSAAGGLFVDCGDGEAGTKQGPVLGAGQWGGLDSGTCPRGCCDVDAPALAQGSRTSSYGSSPTTLPLLLSRHLPREHGRIHMGPSCESGIKSWQVKGWRSPCGELDAERDTEKVRARREAEDRAASAKAAARKMRRKMARKKKKERDKVQEELEKIGRAAKMMLVHIPIQAPMPPPMQDPPPIRDDVHALTSELPSSPVLCSQSPCSVAEGAPSSEEESNCAPRHFWEGLEQRPQGVLVLARTPAGHSKRGRKARRRENRQEAEEAMRRTAVMKMEVRAAEWRAAKAVARASVEAARRQESPAPAAGPRCTQRRAKPAEVGTALHYGNVEGKAPGEPVRTALVETCKWKFNIFEKCNALFLK
jgi:hypothetical protein